MRRFPWKAAVAGGLALGAISVIAALRMPSTSSPQRVALIGDSYAVGLGPELSKIIKDFQYEGHVGTNTWQWAARSAACSSCGSWLPEFKPTTVLVSLGVNDGDAPNRANYLALVQKLQSLGARVVWIEPPAGVKAPLVRAMIASLGVQTVPAPNLILVDGLHPSSYEVWAQQVARYI